MRKITRVYRVSGPFGDSDAQAVIVALFERSAETCSPDPAAVTGSFRMVEIRPEGAVLSEGVMPEEMAQALVVATSVDVDPAVRDMEDLCLMLGEARAPQGSVQARVAWLLNQARPICPGCCDIGSVPWVEFPGWDAVKELTAKLFADQDLTASILRRCAQLVATILPAVSDTHNYSHLAWIAGSRVVNATKYANGVHEVVLPFKDLSVRDVRMLLQKIPKHMTFASERQPCPKCHGAPAMSEESGSTTAEVVQAQPPIGEDSILRGPW